MHTQKRNLGLDLLRLISMAMVVCHHLLTHGGLLFAFPQGSLTGEAVQLLNSFVFCAVNVYAMITGYGMAQTQCRVSRLAVLWLQTLATGVAITAVFALLPGCSVSGSDWLSALLPVSHDTYWYFTAYAGVFVLMPVLNLALQQFGLKQIRLLLAALFVLFCLLPLMGKDPFRLGGGYHMLWLAALYLLGGTFRLHGFGTLSQYGILLYLGGAVLSWVWEPMMNYTSPAMVLASVGLMAAFAGLKVAGRPAKMIAALAPLSFGVYLIHEQPLFRQHLIHMRFDQLNTLSPAGVAAGLLGGWLVIFAGCLAVEWLRARTFDLLGIKGLCERAESKLRTRFARFLP